MGRWRGCVIREACEELATGGKSKVPGRTGPGKHLVGRGLRSRRRSVGNRKKYGELLGGADVKQIQNRILLGRGTESKMLKFVQRTH